MLEFIALLLDVAKAILYSNLFLFKNHCKLF